MAVPVNSFEDFRGKFEALKHSRDLFAFFLFDNRPSQKAVEKFAEEQFDWLDNLAGAARIFFFVFLRRNQVEDSVENPGLEVARVFNIKPNELPGIVLFTLDQERLRIGEGAYLPFDASLFEHEPSRVEEVLADLFSVIQECRDGIGGPEELFEKLRSEVVSLRRKERFRPVMNYLKGRLDTILNFPDLLIESIGKAFAEEAARRLAGGP